MQLHRRQFLHGMAASSIGIVAQAAEPRASSAEPRIRDIRTISALPLQVTELKSAHDRAGNYTAELLPEGEAFEIKSFTPFLTKRDEIEATNKRTDTCTRRHALSVGLEVLNDDQKHLPVLSREQILSYLKSHYVTVQVRIYREPVTRALYLGPRCLAATRAFVGNTLSQAFSPTVAESLNNMRSLGLMLPVRAKATPANLRTLVIAHKNEISSSTRGALAKTIYELMFIRAHEAGPDHLELYVFATSDERTRLHLVKSAEKPMIPADCSVRGAVHFTEYSHGGVYPKKAVTRRSTVSSLKTFAWHDIESFSRKRFDRAAIEDIAPVLDAIISGDLKQPSTVRQ
ncbi:hypothetical protein [Schlesneria paludicola]|uniref:hypothetical protein n=1 Tax=Schlesneria paludicola TaxID=360056 RepID=UPI00029B02BC|nr:hypothetical protein [Schlesneria paludicola]